VFVAKKLIDLTMEIRTGTPVFPGYPTPIVHTWTTIREHGYYSNLLQFVEHTSTHVDAPAHFAEGADTVDRVPLDRFTGEGVVVDIRDLPPRAVVTAGTLRERMGATLDKLGPGWVVLFLTGYDSKAGTPEWFDHPGLGEDAARLLAEKRVNAVGTDAPSIDQPPFPAHKTLLPSGVVVYENLTNLSQLLGRRFQFVGFPLKILGGSASPVRAVAVLEE